MGFLIVNIIKKQFKKVFPTIKLSTNIKHCKYKVKTITLYNLLNIWCNLKCILKHHDFSI